MDKFTTLVRWSLKNTLVKSVNTITGESRYISGPETLRLAHRLRRDNEVIIVGIGTVLCDDPELTCRLARGPSPVRVILDSRLRLPEDSRIAHTARQYKTFVLTTEQAPVACRRALQGCGLRIVPLAADGKRVTFL